MQASLLELQSNVENVLVIPDSVEKTIRNLCALSPNREWSGILFYEFTGDFVSGLTLTCKDVLVLDQGSGTATEFNASNPDVARYMFVNGLVGYCTGLIHSHQSFQTFFSGTDKSTLLQEGKDCNNFLSLIVNNAGSYTAAVTRRVLTKESIYKKTTSKGEYPLFNTDTKVSIPEETQESTFSNEHIKVEYVHLTIQKSSDIQASPECEAFSKVIEKSTTPKYSPVSYVMPSRSYGVTYSTEKTKDEDKTEEKPGDYYGDLFAEYGVQRKKDETFTPYVEESEEEILEEQRKNINWNDKEYLLLLEKMFFGTPFISEPKHNNFRDEIRYVANNFNYCCSKAFGNTLDMENWFYSSVDYYLYESVLPEMKKTKEYEEYFDDTAVIAYHFSKALEEWEEKSEYIGVARHVLQSKI